MASEFRTWLSQVIQPAVHIEINELKDGSVDQDGNLDIEGRCNAPNRCRYIYIFVRQKHENLWTATHMCAVEGSGKWAGSANLAFIRDGSRVTIEVRGADYPGSVLLSVRRSGSISRLLMDT